MSKGFLTLTEGSASGAAVLCMLLSGVFSTTSAQTTCIENNNGQYPKQNVLWHCMHYKKDENSPLRREPQ